MKKMLAGIFSSISMIAAGAVQPPGAAPPAAAIPVIESGAPRTIFRPKLEAPKGTYDWMTQATFVATLELEGTPRKVDALRIRFYQVK